MVKGLRLSSAGFLVCAGALTCPAQGQRADRTAELPYRLYVGVHAAAQLFHVTSATYPVVEVVIRPVYGYVGYHFTPRLALQVGFLQHRPASSVVDQVGFNPGGQVVISHSSYSRYSAAVPVLLRYRLSRRVTRLQADALLGLTAVFHQYRGQYVQSVDGQTTQNVYEYANARNANLTGGFSLRLRVTPRVDLAVEGTAHRNLTAVPSAYAKQLLFGVGAGLRYRFDFKKKPAASPSVKG